MHLRIRFTIRGGFQSLILESSSPGLKTEDERATRRETDHRLAERILQMVLPSFIDFWENIPLFKTQKELSEEQRQVIREERLSQREIGLANSLRGIGTGSQTSYWERLKAVNIPVLLINGGSRHEIRKYFPGNAETIPHCPP